MHLRLRWVDFAGALLIFCIGEISVLSAETSEAANGRMYHDVCSAIAAAVPEDTIEVSGPAAASHCAWTTTPNLRSRASVYLGLSKRKAERPFGVSPRTNHR